MKKFIVSSPFLITTMLIVYFWLGQHELSLLGMIERLWPIYVVALFLSVWAYFAAKVLGIEP